MLMSSSVASCSTSCQKGSAASGTWDSWRTPAAAPSFQSSALLCKRRSRDPLLNPPIIASATQSSPVIVSICAQSVVAAWSRWAFRRARHRGDAQHRAVTPHDDQPRTRLFAHHCAHLHADAPCRNVEPCPQNLTRVLASLICCQNACDSSHTQSPDLFFTTVCSWLNRTGEQSTIEPPAAISNAHKPRSTTRGFVQSGFK